MSQPLYWPGRYYFYGIGNTPTISLTRDLSPRTPANILLLGCGDPRNVLFTVYNEDYRSERHLDITCSDIDPGIIARNIFLVTMIIDKIPSSTMWNIFFDLKIDRDTHSTLLNHCNKLCKFSNSQNNWESSAYGSLIKFSTIYTLKEARRHWQLYVEMETLPSDRQKAIRDAFTAQSQEAVQKMRGITFSSARAAGPLMHQAISVYSEHTKHYAATGISSIDPSVLYSATFLNPTFSYCFVGEGCNVHYATSPLTPFHSAALFGNAKRTLGVKDVVLAAQKQFGEWCDGFHDRITSQPSRVTLRFAVAEATAICQAFQNLNEHHRFQTEIPISQWKSTRITFDSTQYGSLSNPAPSSFDVIDTSNLVDHIGLLNILVSTIPLRSPEGVIYTESLLYKGDDATKEFAEQLFADLGTVSLILGVVPIDYLSGFFSRSNTHEIMLHSLIPDGAQFHQVTTWKSPTSADATNGARPSVVFDNMQLGTFFWDMYHCMFEEEDSMKYWAKHGANMKAIAKSSIIHYNRESFVLFLRLARSNLGLSVEDWESVMERFLDLQESDTTMPMDTVNRQDFHSHLYRYVVHTVSTYRSSLRRVGRFSEWSSVPQIVRVLLTVPRSVLEDVFEGPNIGTPVLQCTVSGSWSMNAFSAVHAVFGRVSTLGTKAAPRISFEEDKDGWKGTSPLVVSFSMPTQLLVNIEPQAKLKVNFSIRSTAATTLVFARKLGLNLNVFSADLLDEAQVQVLPEPLSPSTLFTDIFSNMPQLIGPCKPVVVSLDEECERVSWLSARIEVQDLHVVRSFGSLGAIPEVKQLSPCVVRVTVSGVLQDIVFPYPVRGKDHRLRLARKSLYIEVLVPPSGPSKSGGLSPRPFLTVQCSHQCPEIQTWNVHYVNLSRLPLIDCSRPKELYKWLNPHIGSMMSTRERKQRKKHEKDDLMFVKDTLHAIMVRTSGIQGVKARRLFSLMDKATHNSDTLLFVNGLRYDQSAHTVVCDAFILPLTEAILERHSRPFSKLVNSSELEHVQLMEGEVASWKHLIPAFVERCRMSWSHGENCEYKVSGRIPLTEEIEHNPLCSCGEGKDVEEMLGVPLWQPFACYVTRIALSPLFAVSYLEPIGRDINSRRCWLCRCKGKPRLKECSRCRKVRYCSPECQKKDWAAHRKKCT
ncbi:hypothetical protein DFH05DRAFT_1394437 [Lentinula detonsa]|uniref:MYND-type domain-containing protein n=1 Tax=Lentinula detonsa TaxID=2804962 RepID=A0A9W8P3X3_9AGAR|nr:hypothetical protein DFH05DRAFT_1394437 [Lentinula detonsa]